MARTPGPPLRARRPTADDAGGKPHRRRNRRFWSGFEIARRRRLPDRPRDDAQPRAKSASVAVRQPARAARSRGGGGGGENRIGERHVVRDERRPRVFDFVGDCGVGISIARRDDRARVAFGPGGDARAPRSHRTAAARRAGSLARRARGRGGGASRRSRHRVRVGWIVERASRFLRRGSRRIGGRGGVCVRAMGDARGRTSISGDGDARGGGDGGRGSVGGSEGVRRRAHADGVIRVSRRSRESRRRVRRDPSGGGVRRGGDGDGVSERWTCSRRVRVVARGRRVTRRVGARARKPRRRRRGRIRARGRGGARHLRRRGRTLRARGRGGARHRRRVRARRRRTRGRIALFDGGASRRVRARRDDRSSSRGDVVANGRVASRRGVSRDGGDVSRATRRGDGVSSLGRRRRVSRRRRRRRVERGDGGGGVGRARGARRESRGTPRDRRERAGTRSRRARRVGSRETHGEGRSRRGWNIRSTRDVVRGRATRGGGGATGRRAIRGEGVTPSLRARVTPAGIARVGGGGKGAAQVPGDAVVRGGGGEPRAGVGEGGRRGGIGIGGGGVRRGRCVRRGRGGAGGSPVATGAPFAVVRASVRGGWRSGAGAGAKDASPGKSAGGSRGRAPRDVPTRAGEREKLPSHRARGRVRRHDAAPRARRRGRPRAIVQPPREHVQTLGLFLRRVQISRRPRRAGGQVRGSRSYHAQIRVFRHRQRGIPR